MGIWEAYDICPQALSLVREVERDLEEGKYFARTRLLREENQLRLLAAFREARISQALFSATTGYGYDDAGRDRLEQAFAALMGSEKAFLRIQLSSGTQALAMGFFSCLRPGDSLLSASGLPYDTLLQTIGIRASNDASGFSYLDEDLGSLHNYGVSFSLLDLKPDGSIDLSALKAALLEAKSKGRAIKMLHLQRSRGYSDRRALRREDIEPCIRLSKEISPETIVFVDNCYGEFTDTTEPGHWGADLMAGSFIKNPGGGIASSGAYICGKTDLVELAASRFTAPGIGSEIGPSLGFTRELTQGLYLAPHVVAECLMGLDFAAMFSERLGIASKPSYREPRGDIIQSFMFKKPEELVKFCQAVQFSSPVDSFVRPYPSPLPGYQDEVIMAAGTFVQGSSIELSADGPMREPYIAYLQGGLVYEQLKLAMVLAAKDMGLL